MGTYLGTLGSIVDLTIGEPLECASYVLLIGHTQGYLGLKVRELISQEEAYVVPTKVGSRSSEALGLESPGEYGINITLGLQPSDRSLVLNLL
jgi:hypothetical protein